MIDISVQGMTKKLIAISLGLLIAVISSGSSFAYNKGHYKELVQSKSCSGCDLSSLNLKRWNLKGADLEDANLRYANFKGADLRYANLEDADIKGANFRGARLAGAIWIDGKTCSKNSLSRCVNKY